MTSASLTEPRGFRVRGVHVLLGVIAFFAVVIGVDVVFTVIAIRTFPGQVSVTPYEDGLIYNRHIAQMNAQARLGWRASAQSLPGETRVVVADREGKAVTGLAVRGALKRPATEAGGSALAFTETAPGVYDAPTGRLSGAWDLTFEARGDGQSQSFQAERRLIWP